MDWLVVILFIYALSKIAYTWNHHQAVNGLIAAKRVKDEEEIKLKVRLIEAREGKVAKAELKKQIQLIEAMLPLKTFDRESLRKLPVSVRSSIAEATGLDADVIESYLKMSDVEIQRVKLGL